MGSMAYQATQVVPGMSILVPSFVRTLVNFALILLPVVLRGDQLKSLWGDGRRTLWFRGLFGSLALVCSFLGIQAIGVAENSFIHSSNVVFIALLAPWFLGQKNNVFIWLAIAGSIAGLALLFEPRFHDGAVWGRATSLASGVFAALAYLMVSRAGRSNKPQTVIFYFLIVGILIHLVLFWFVPPIFPTDLRAWMWMIGAGLSATLGQHFLTIAYTRGHAASNAIVSQMGPVLNFAAGVLFFSQVPDSRSIAGGILVVGCGMLVPFARGVHFLRRPKPR